MPGSAHTHLARRLSDIDRGDPLDHQLMLGVDDLLWFVIQFACPPIESIPLQGSPGGLGPGTEILIGVLEATVRDPNENWRVGHPADSPPVAAGG